MNLELEEIFTTYQEKHSKAETSLEQLRVQLKPYIKHIVLYGAGSAGLGFLLALRKAAIEPIAFLDSNPAKKGQVIEGLTVHSPTEFIANHKTLVIICINTDGQNFNGLLPQSLRKETPDSLVSDLSALGYRNVLYYQSFWRCYELFQDEKFPLPSCSDVKSILNNRTEIHNVFSFYEEKCSREIFLKYLSFRLLDSSVKIPTESVQLKYLQKDIFTFIEHECFIDGGAFNGNTIERLVETMRVAEYHGIEPDNILFNKLERCVSTLSNKIESISLYSKALHNNKDIMKFYQFGGPGSLIFPLGNVQVEGITLNDMQFKSEPTYIKLNIEGCEQYAIEGGVEVISKCAPIIAVRLLKIRDLWEIPKQLNKLFSGYKFFLRTYMNHLDFYLYAVPPRRLK
jgi:FkbM family methyltransferase